MSKANAAKATAAARKETSEGRRVMVTCEKSERMNAMRVTPVARERRIPELVTMCDWVEP